MHPTPPRLIRVGHHDTGRYRRPVAKQLALFVHLARMQWKLSNRIPWGRLSEAQYTTLAEVQPMLDRIAGKARTARIRNRTSLTA
jgi:hypothetical protein